MKKHIRRTMIIISMLLIICVALGLCQNYLFVLDDHNAWRIRGFYLEDKDSLDVVFLGVSDIYSGIIPSRLYSEYGITSYDFASADSSVSLWKSQVKEILKRQNPQYIVIEINGVVEGDDGVLNDNSGLRRYTDGMPLSWNKVETILNYNLKEEILSYFFPLIKYHGETGKAKKVLKENLYYQKQGFAALKGFNTKTQIDKRTNLLDVDYAKRLPLSPKTEEALMGFLDYCQDNNLHVVFTRFPHKIMREEMVERAYRGNQAEEIIKEYGFDFIHLERDYQDAQIDPDTDYYNDDHLNIYGAQKLTHYWGELLTTKYGVTPHELSKTQQKEWDYTVDYTNRFLVKAEQRIKDGIKSSFYETAALKAILYD